MEVTSNILPSYILNQPTPSQADGVSVRDEKLHRVYGCELVMQSGTILKLPQVVMVTGQNILNRFFYRKSLKRFDVFSIAMGSLLLASKVEESFKTLREILFAFHHLYAKRKGLQLMPMELGGQQYTTWKNELIMIERYILKELGFSLYNIMDHPHKYILYFIKVLNGNEALANEAWSYLNDSMRLDVSLQYEAQTIACAAIYLAARKVDFPLPEDAATGVWWEVFGAETADMDKICTEILGLYHFKKFDWLEPIAEVEYLSPETCAAFDKELLIEAPAAPSSTDAAAEAVLQSTLTSNVQPFGQSSSRRGAAPAAGGDSTPVGDGSATPTNGSTPVRDTGATAAGGAETEGGGKLARKWFSVVGDIDKLDDVPAVDANTSKAAPSSRHSASKSREAVRENNRERSRERDRSSKSYNMDGARSRDSRYRGRSDRRADDRYGEARSRPRSSSRDRDQDRSRNDRDRGHNRDTRDRRDGDRRPTSRDDHRGGREKDRDRVEDREGYRGSQRPRSRSRDTSDRVEARRDGDRYSGREKERERDGGRDGDRRRDSRSPKRRRQ